jgi:lysozyme family protein
MTNKYRDKLDRLKRQHVNNHGRVQIRPEQREFNVKRVVRRVNTNVDEFVADNANTSEVYFDEGVILQLNTDFLTLKYFFHDTNFR